MFFWNDVQTREGFLEAVEHGQVGLHVSVGDWVVGALSRLALGLLSDVGLQIFKSLSATKRLGYVYWTLILNMFFGLTPGVYYVLSTAHISQVWLKWRLFIISISHVTITYRIKHWWRRWALMELNTPSWLRDSNPWPFSLLQPFPFLRSIMGLFMMSPQRDNDRVGSVRQDTVGLHSFSYSPAITGPPKIWRCLLKMK